MLIPILTMTIWCMCLARTIRTIRITTGLFGADLQTLTGGWAAAELADGSTLELEVEPGEMGDYVLTVQDGTGTYTENGYTWCSYNYPEELSYDENFPPDQYDCFHAQPVR